MTLLDTIRAGVVLTCFVDGRKVFRPWLEDRAIRQRRLRDDQIRDPQPDPAAAPRVLAVRRYG